VVVREALEPQGASAVSEAAMFDFGERAFGRFVIERAAWAKNEVALAGEAVFELSNLVSEKTVTPAINRIEASRD
jgi:hypothetical protein